MYSRFQIMDNHLFIVACETRSLEQIINHLENRLGFMVLVHEFFKLIFFVAEM